MPLIGSLKVAHNLQFLIIYQDYVCIEFASERYFNDDFSFFKKK